MDISQIHVIYSNLIDMLGTRKYEIDLNDILTLEEFVKRTSSSPSIEEALPHIFEKKEKKILILWHDSLGNSQVSQVYERMQIENVNRAIVLVRNKITPQASMSIRMFRYLGYIIEVFTHLELSYNVLAHEYVPKHVICSAKTKKEVLEKFGVTKDKIPKISLDDPVIKRLGASRGNLIKIIRPSETISEGTDVTYKIVV